MTTGTAPPISGPDDAQTRRQLAELESFIDTRIRQTRRQVKSVDVWVGLVTLAAGTLVYLLLAALADHWLVPGGLGFAGRVVLFAVLVITGGGYLGVRVLPLLVRRVNPIFAAHSIEQSRPSLKNSLINFLYLRRERDQIRRDRLATGIYHALERKAASDLEQIPADVAVDRSPLIRLGYVLAAILALGCLYVVASPKSPLVSFYRVLWPWADVKAPTRVTIENVEPGDDLVYQGQLVNVWAEVDGLADDEPVMLYYSTADGQSVDQAVPMTRPEGSSRFGAELPPGRFGLQQDVEYCLVAGDCRTRRFRLEAQTALSILVDSVEYDYPDYTGIPDRVDHRVADLKAIEGTRVTIRGTANREIRRAAVELDGDPRHALKMSPAGPKTAKAEFTLMMSRDDPRRAEHESYQLRFTDASGRESDRPIRHRIDVMGDLAPEIRFVAPPPEEIELPEDAVLELRVRAVDPDFALRRVAVRAERDQRSLSIPPLLNRKRPEPPHEGPFQTTYRFEPAALGLKAGDKVIYWAEAEDNMVWEEDGQDTRPGPNHAKTARRWPNRAETARRWITIVPPEGRWPPEQRPDGRPQPPKPSQENTQKKPDQPPTEPQETGKLDDGGEPGQKQQEPSPTGQQPGQSGQPGQGQPDPKGQESAAPKGQESAAPKGQESAAQEGQESAAQRGRESSGQNQSGDEGGALRSGESSRGEKSQETGQGSGQQGAGQESTGQEASEQGQGRQQGMPSRSTPGTDQRPAAEPGQSAEQQPDPQSRGQVSPRSEPVDGQTDPGDAFEEILRHLDERSRNEGASGLAAKSGEQQGEPQEVAQREGTEPSTPSAQPAEQQPDGAKAPQASTPPPQSTPGEQPDGQGQAQPDARQPRQGEAASSAAKPGEEQQAPDNGPALDQTGGPGPKPAAGQGAQAKGHGETTEEPSPGQKPENPEARGGDPQQTQGQGGHGKPSSEDQGSPSPQEANQKRKKQVGEGDQSEPSEGESAQSPTTSPKDSDSRGDTSGDRSGGGEQGGGQKSEQSGTGTAGTHTASEQGGSQSQQQGEGPTGPRPGDQVEADRPTGRPADQGEGPGSGQLKRPGAKPSGQDSAAPQAGPSPNDRSDSQQPADAEFGGPGPGRKGRHPSGYPSPAGGPDQERAKPLPMKPGTYQREDPNLDYARQQTNLALEYLEDQLAKDAPDEGLLRRLGWTKEDLRRFYEQWNRMRQEAGQSDSARGDFDRALDSLGLRPHALESRGGRADTDRIGQLRESLRIDPPPERADAYRAYRIGVAGGNE